MTTEFKVGDTIVAYYKNGSGFRHIGFFLSESSMIVRKSKGVLWGIMEFKKCTHRQYRLLNFTDINRI